MLKKTILMLLASIALCFTGCKTVEVINENSTPKVMTSAPFNQETFIWEQFLFPTNRTTGRQ